jgi:hypothetical protein
MLHLFLMRTCHHRHLPECRWQSVASSRRHRFPLRLFARSATIALARARLLLCSGRVRARSSSRPHHPKKVVITRISQHRCTIAAAFAHRRRKLGRRTDRRSCLPQEQLIMGGDYVLDPITQQECPMPPSTLTKRMRRRLWLRHYAKRMAAACPVRRWWTVRACERVLRVDGRRRVTPSPLPLPHRSRHSDRRACACLCACACAHPCAARPPARPPALQFST